MKRSIIIIACIVCSLTMNAQTKESWRQRVQAEKIAYLTTAVDFTPEEAQLFWPVYNQYWKEYSAAHKQTMKAFGQLQNTSEKRTEKEYETLTEAYLKALEAEQSVIILYYPKFKKVLPAEKVARFFVADENFRKQTLRNLCSPRKSSDNSGKSRDHRKND